MILAYVEWIWIVVAILILVAELATATLFILPFATAAFAGAITAFLGGSISTQITVAAVTAGVSMLAFRPFMARLVGGGDRELLAGTERLVGASGRVLGTLPGEGEGFVSVEGERWRVKLMSRDDLHDGDEVRVTGFKGSRLLVVAARRVDVRGDEPG